MNVRCLLLALMAAGSPVSFQETGAVDLVLENGATGDKHMIETMPGGLAILDYDNDGRPDLYFTNGAESPSLKKDGPKFANRLFHNEGGMKFRAVEGAAGEGYSMGAAAGDFDNDGNPDLFVAGVYHNILYRNLGNGRFQDVTAKSGIQSDEWSVAAAWLDFDNDGKLDLLVINYGAWPGEKERFCGDQTRKLRIYCHPKYYEPRPNQLYRNRGDGTFEDVSDSSGIGKHRGRGMAVAIADYDRDGRMDVFVSNDNLPNFLFHNKGGKFEEVALTAGVALRDSGQPIASMGADFRDYDNDGWPDLATVGLTGETFPIFHNEKNGTFRDATYSSKVGPQSIRRAGWGAVWADFDNDGWKDLFTSNAHVNDIVEQFEPTTYKQPNSLFLNKRDGTFSAADSPELAARASAHRGLAVADLDGDGKLDAVVSVLGERAEVWRNTSAASNHWIGIKLRGVKSNRDGIGALIRIGDQVNHMTSSHGYASSSLTPVHFGLGATTKIPRVEVHWPAGSVQVLENVAADQVITVTEQ